MHPTSRSPRVWHIPVLCLSACIKSPTWSRLRPHPRLVRDTSMPPSEPRMETAPVLHPVTPLRMGSGLRELGRHWHWCPLSVCRWQPAAARCSGSWSRRRSCLQPQPPGQPLRTLSGRAHSAPTVAIGQHHTAAPSFGGATARTCCLVVDTHALPYRVAFKCASLRT